MFDLFLTITNELNLIGITPLLMGSVGLEVRTGRDWKARDLDIHVPSDPREDGRRLMRGVFSNSLK
ncbi:putative phosphoribosylanthranilate isomerase [Streptococcus agalactiae]|nr:putative phosphoribosylanthranilate isomerase [Streptococcus agalactiae]